jgi:hypothetical protein
MGPFLGLDTVHQPREISRRHAVRADNVLVDNGTIQVRPPLVEDTRFAGYPPGKVYAGVDWYPPRLSAARLAANVVHVGNMLYCNLSVGGLSGLQERQGTFAFGDQALYYVDGLRVLRIGGDLIMHQVGIPPPTTTLTPTATDAQIDTGFPPPVQGQILWQVKDLPARPISLQELTEYQFGFSYYDADSGAESNAVFTDNFTTLDGVSRPRLRIVWGATPTGRHITHVRAYVRNVTAGQTGFVFWFEFPIGSPFPQDYDFLVPGSEITGPFAPTRNGIPEYASVAYFYKSRMYYNDLRNPALLRYSAINQPAHVHPDDFLLADDDGNVTGLQEQAGQLVVGKERSAWILSGAIVGATNETVATGAALLPSGHDFYRTKVVVGCANNAGGNGIIPLGSSRVGWNGADGFYTFDGLSETKVSGLIDPTWREFVGDQTWGRNQAVTYGLDPERQLLYMVNLSIDNQRTKVLCCHYGVEGGAWTTISPDDPADNPSCILQVVGTRTPADPPEPGGGEAELQPTGLALVVGTNPFRVLTLRDRDHTLPMPAFAYQGGRVILKEGLDGHFYWVRWFLSNSLPAGVLQRQIEVGFRTSPRNVDEYKVIDLMTGPTAHHKVAEVGSDITVLLRNPQSGDSRWHPNFSIVGFGLDAEPVGQ